MKNLHIPTILVTLGLVGLVAILSGQSTVGTPRVVVHNPLGVPGWVPSGVWMARRGYDPATGIYTDQDYTVPAGHFALVTSIMNNSSQDAKLHVNEGNGFYVLAREGEGPALPVPGIVVDEGTVIRADMGSSTATESTVHGYVIPK